MKTIGTFKRKIITVSILAISAMSLLAEEVYVTSYIGPVATVDLTPCPNSCSTGFSTNGTRGPASTALPNLIPERRIMFGKETGAIWTVTPMDVTYTPESGGSYAFTSLHYTSVYQIYVTKGQSSGASTNIIVTMTATGGVLADVNGVGSAAVVIDAFQASKPNNAWILVGYITNTIANPTLTFTHTGGVCDVLSRWYADTVRFSSFDPPWITLHYSVTGGQITFTWTGNCTLQARSTVKGGLWNDITATSGHQESLSSNTSTFFRLRNNL